MKKQPCQSCGERQRLLCHQVSYYEAAPPCSRCGQSKPRYTLAYAVECLSCLARGPVRPTRTQAITAWNGSSRRAVDVPVSSLNEAEVIRQLTFKAMAEADGNRERAAKLLGIGERTLYRRLKRYEE